MVVPVFLLRRVAIRKPNLRAMRPHDVAHHLGCPAVLHVMQDRVFAHEYPVIAVRSLDAHPVRRENDSPDHFLFRLTIAGYNVRLAQRVDSLLPGGL